MFGANANSMQIQVWPPGIRYLSIPKVQSKERERERERDIEKICTAEDNAFEF